MDDARKRAYETLGTPNPNPPLRAEDFGYVELVASPDPALAVPVIFELAHTKVRLGRYSSAGTYATTSDLFVAVCDEATAIAPMNTMFENLGGDFHVFDTRSKNGTFVNGDQITKRRKLAPRDVIDVGGSPEEGGARLVYLGPQLPPGRHVRRGPEATEHKWQSRRGGLVITVDSAAGTAVASLKIDDPHVRDAALMTAQRFAGLAHSPHLPTATQDARDPDLLRYRVGEPLTELPAGWVYDAPTAYAIAADMCDAAAACHDAGPSHSVIGPFERGLVWRKPDGRAVLFGAGLARAMHEREQNVRGHMMTPRHFRLSPEECNGWPTGPATDVFYAAYFAVELVLGYEPYPTGELVTYMDHIVKGMVELPDLPPSVLVRAFSPEPSSRPTLAQLASALRNA
jgi:hypothetical protein